MTLWGKPELVVGVYGLSRYKPSMRMPNKVVFFFESIFISSKSSVSCFPTSKDHEAALIVFRLLSVSLVLLLV